MRLKAVVRFHEICEIYSRYGKAAALERINGLLENGYPIELCEKFAAALKL
jgi:hypothetical protein